jgi:hypothetical protein
MADGGDIPVSVNRGKVAYIVCIFTLLLIIWVWGDIAFPQAPWYTILLVVFVAIFVLGVGPNIRLLFLSDPYLVVSDEGIRIQDPFINGEMIPWSDIQDLRIYGQNAITITLRHPADVLARQNWMQRRHLRFNMLGSHGISAPSQYLSVSPDDLVREITQRYESQLLQYQVEILDFPRRRKWSAIQEQGQ